MSKKRVIACLVVRHGLVVQSRRFADYLPVGRPEIAARFLSDWGADEIVLLDIAASAEGRLVDPELVRRVARGCHVPLAVGGGIRSVDNMRTLLQAGADKVVVNTLALQDPAVIGEAAAVFGDQCVIASLDARRTGTGHYRVYGRSGTLETRWDPAEFAHRMAGAGAGEILVNSIDRDGTQLGYDLELIDRVAPALTIPVIALGGAGGPAHLQEALRRDHVSAAAAANYFHYSEHSLAVAKAWLRAHGVSVRYESLSDYSRSGFDEARGRIDRHSDAELDEMIFEYVPDEII